MKKIKENKAITLVALVVTIIVLLILATVSLNLVLGDNGIIIRAKQASQETNEAIFKEQVAMAVAGSIDESGEINYSSLKENLLKIQNISGVPETINSSSFPIEVTLGNYSYIIQANGQSVDVVEDEETGFLAKYNLVEYIESTGTTYINTGVLNGPNIDIEAEILGPNTTTVYAFLGGRTTTNAQLPTSYSLWGSASNVPRFDRGGKMTPLNSNLPKGVRCKIKIDKLQLYVNDTLIATNPGTLIYEPTNNIYIFGQNTADVSQNNIAGIRFYYLKMYDDGDLIRDMVPCSRKSDNIAGMYDKVNGVFYTNAASDENFIVRSDT